MELHIFKCKSNSTIFGFTQDLTGANLPTNICKGGWVYWKTKTIEIGMPLIGGVPVEILEGVAAQGYHIAGAGVVFDSI